jgi:hypothetical protein
MLDHFPPVNLEDVFKELHPDLWKLRWVLNVHFQKEETVKQKLEDACDGQKTKG